MEIHQVVVSASPGDAVTNVALAFQTLLRRVCPSRVFARYIHTQLADQVLPLFIYEDRLHADDLLIYHMSIGEPEVVQFLLGRPQRLVLVYHNITPARYFAQLDPAFAGLLASGRSELALLRERTELALADSAYNARDLEALGYADVRVSPLPVDINALSDVHPDPVLSAELEALKGPVVLFVGQLVPHKRPDLLVEAYHILTRYLIPEAHLVLSGSGRFERYRAALTTLITQLELDRVRIPGWVRSDELAAYYNRADVFATMSEHEGFCVPLVEAMSFDLPIVARDYAAIPETLGEAGLILPPDDDPALVAEALALLISDDTLRATLVGRGRRRLAAFDPHDAEASFLGHLGSII